MEEKMDLMQIYLIK